MADFERKATQKKKKGFAGFLGNIGKGPAIGAKSDLETSSTLREKTLAPQRSEDVAGNARKKSSSPISPPPVPAKGFVDNRTSSQDDKLLPKNDSMNSADGSLANAVQDAQGLRRSFVDIRRGRKTTDGLMSNDMGAYSMSVTSSRNNSFASSVSDVAGILERVQFQRRSNSLIIPKNQEKLDEYKQANYDNPETDYVVCEGELVHDRYLMERVIGRGSFGQVVRAYDTVTRQRVAVKIIRSDKGYFDQAQTEVRMTSVLQQLDPDDRYNLMRTFDTFIFRGHQCLVFELLSFSLYDSLMFRSFKGMSITDVKSATVQMLHALNFFAQPEINIIHCDIKPENILTVAPTGARGNVKLVDFGSACFGSEPLSLYVQSRFYRAPEVLLGCASYNTQIDMWSLGCTLIELFIGVPVFPGQDEPEQVCLVVEKLGIPPAAFLSTATRKPLFFDDNRGKITLKPGLASREYIPGAVSLESFIRERCSRDKNMKQEQEEAMRSQFIDLVKKMLVYEPEKRIRPSMALNHPFVAGGADADQGVSLTSNMESEEGGNDQPSQRISGRHAPAPRISKKPEEEEIAKHPTNEGMPRNNSGSNSSNSEIRRSSGSVTGSVTGSMTGSMMTEDDMGPSKGENETLTEWKTHLGIKAPLWRYPMVDQPVRPPSVFHPIREAEFRKAGQNRTNRCGAVSMFDDDDEYETATGTEKYAEVTPIRFNPDGSLVPTVQHARIEQVNLVGRGRTAPLFRSRPCFQAVTSQRGGYGTGHGVSIQHYSNLKFLDSG